MAVALGKGAKLQRDVGGTQTLLPNVTSISGPSAEAEEVDITDMQTAGDFRDFLQGLKDGGTVEAEINWDPDNAEHTGTNGVLEDYLNGTERTWQIIYPGATGSAPNETPRLEFTAFVQNIPQEIPVASQMTITVTLRIKGAFAVFT